MGADPATAHVASVFCLTTIAEVKQTEPIKLYFLTFPSLLPLYILCYLPHSPILEIRSISLLRGTRIEQKAERLVDKHKPKRLR